MATYGFCENKCKHEVYTKEETDNKYKLNGDFAVITGTIELSGKTGDTVQTGIVPDISYPEGFTKDNCVVLSIGFDNTSFTMITFGSTSAVDSLNDGGVEKKVRLNDDTMSLRIYYDWGAALSEDKIYTYSYKIVLMKV